MQWRIIDGYIVTRKTSVERASAGDRVHSSIRLLRMGLLLSAGTLLTVSCSKVDLPKSAQDQNSSPAPNSSASQDWTKSVSWLLSPQATPAPLTDAQVPTAPNPPAAAGTAATAVSPAFSPNPAQGAKEAAMKMYPQLGVKDSTFNKTFRDLYLEESRKNPELLTRADWPLVLAHRTADILTPPAPARSQSQAPAAAPEPQIAESRVEAKAQSRPAAPTPSSNPLDRGAYNQTRSPYWWPWVRYY